MKRLNVLLPVVLIAFSVLNCTTTTPHKADVPYMDGAIHTVQGDESLEMIAATYEVTPQLLRRVNNLKHSEQLNSGERVFIPGAAELRAVATDQAMEELVAQEPAAPVQPRRPDGLYHTVGKGENLLAIANAYDVSMRELQRINMIKDPSHIELGQRLWIPRAKEVKDVEIPKVKVVTAEPVPEFKKSPRVVQEVQPQPTPKPKPEEKEKIHEFPRKVEEFAEIRFQWPIKDSFKVLRGYSENTGEKNPGIDLGAEIGTPVYAAANGEVKVVAGPSDPLGASLGNHVIIYHGEKNNKGIYTIYAHNESVTVAPGQQVKRGEQIATVGRSGRPAVGENGVLHFQVRELHKPVNPRNVLPHLN